MSFARRNPAPPEPTAVGRAVREAAHFDRDLVSLRGGLLAAIPVVATLGAGLAVNDPTAAATMGAGAMLVGIAWRTGGGRPPLALMATDAVVMAAATFVGSVTGSVSWLHFAVVCATALSAGLLVGVGNRGAVVGVQAIIAVVVFGRFSQPPAAALGLAGLVLAGGCAQLLFVGLVRWPSPLRAQRAATASAYRALAALAAGPDRSTLPVAAALDEASASLASPHLFGDSALMTLRDLVNEGHRLRVQLSVIGGLIGQRRAARDGRPARAGERSLELAAEALSLAARAIDGEHGMRGPLRRRVAQLTAETDALADELATRTLELDPVSAAPVSGSVELHMSRRLSALAGQLRAVAALAPAAGEGGGLRSRRPHPRANRPLAWLRENLAQTRANMSLQSSAGRHALRLGVVVAVADLISNQLAVERGYWMVVAAAAVLRPDFAGTFTRGAERALGTCAGVALAGAIVVAFHPGDGLTLVLVGLLAWAAYSTFPASFAAGFGFITAVIVFLLNIVSPATLATASVRLLDSLIGSAIGLLAYALWPTWSRTPARQSLAELLDAQRAYLAGVLGFVISGRQAPEREMRSLSRRARLARTNAEATIAQSLSEPASRQIDRERTQGSLGAMRRLVQAVHLLRLDAQEDRDRQPFPELAPLAGDFDAMLRIVGAVMDDHPRHDWPAVPDLRAAYIDFERRSRYHDDRARAALLFELDEIVDSANGLAALAGLDPIDPAVRRPQRV